jgi:hypothetical protein
MATTFPLRLGDAGQYELSEDAFKHILWGDTAIRPVDTNAGRVLETVLSGGLHTYQGWKKFVALHPKVVHLLQFRVGIHDAWYYARELQNGVITLKIPRRLFTGNAASITQQPDNYYKSGYLWKTLFPVRYTDDDLLQVIREALLNLDREDSTVPTAEQPAGVLYGYAATDDPFTAIKVRIQVRGNQILSAFPAWDQPATGNNGKPYSHVHSISFLIAESTLDHEIANIPYGPVFPGNVFDLEVLVERTPEFIKARQLRNPSDRVDASRAARAKVLRKFAGKATPADLDLIDEYLADYPCAKDPFGVQRGIYQYYQERLEQSPKTFNTAQVTENIGECLWVLAFCDNRFKSRRAVAAIVRFLSMAVVHTGGLNTLMFKSLLGKMVTIARTHHDAAALKDVLAALASSPCRAALYTDFDLNPFAKKNNADGLVIAGLPVIEIELKVSHLLEFIAFNLGENYLAMFSKDDRIAMARAVIDGPGHRRLAEDAMERFVGRDFEFFMPQKLDFSELTTQTPPSEKDLLAITRDYGRMLVMLRQRIVLEDPDAYNSEPDYSQMGTRAFFELMRQKHKHMVVRSMHNQMLETTKAYAENIGYADLSKACQAAIDRLPKERIPLPKYIPDYIDSWQKKSPPADRKATHTIEEIFGAAAARGA